MAQGKPCIRMPRLLHVAAVVLSSCLLVWSYVLLTYVVGPRGATTLITDTSQAEWYVDWDPEGNNVISPRRSSPTMSRRNANDTNNYQSPA